MLALGIGVVIAALTIGYATPIVAQQFSGGSGSTGFKFSEPMPPDVASSDKGDTRSGTPAPPKIHELLTLLADPKN